MNTEDTSLIYHYTSPAAFLGIIGQHRLWASSPLMMNDSGELGYGRELIDEVVSSLRDPVSRIASTLLGELDASGTLGSIYMTCASNSGDLLNQWQNYAGEAAYSIGLDARTNLWPEQVSTPYGGQRGRAQINTFIEPRWYPVIYDRDIVVFAAREIFLRYANNYDQNEEDLKNGSPRNWRTYGSSEIAALICRAKHPAFSAECEWRFLTIVRDDSWLNFRTTPLGMTSYVKLTGYTSEDSRFVARLPVRTVTLGPGHSSASGTSKTFVEKYLRNSYYAPDVRVSQIPYRYGA